MNDLFADIGDEDLDDMYDSFHRMPPVVQNRIRALNRYLDDTEAEQWCFVLNYLYELQKQHGELLRACEEAREWLGHPDISYQDDDAWARHWAVEDELAVAIADARGNDE